MRTLDTVGAAALVVLGLLIGGCGSDAATETSSAASTASSVSAGSSAPASPSSAPPTPPQAAAGKSPTLIDFITQNGLTSVPVKQGDPGIPTLKLPVPAGWQDAGPQTPQGAWGALVFADPGAAADPATITVNMTKLTGRFDQSKIFDYAAGQLKNLPGFQGSPGAVAPKKLGGYPAYQIAGAFDQNGVKRMVAQKTVVIPAKGGGGVFVVQITAAGLQDQMGPLLDATANIDAKATITP